MMYNDLISRREMIDDLELCAEMANDSKVWIECIKRVADAFPAQIDIQTHLCDSCKYTFPDCKTTINDILFGNGKGNDNICACNGYSPVEKVVGEIRIDTDEIMERLEQEWYKPNEWIPCSERLPERDEIVLVSYKTTDKVHMCKYLDDGSENPWWSYNDDCLAWNNVVLAWMPLPEPFRGDEE